MMMRRSDSFVLMLLMAVALMAGCGKRKHWIMAIK